MKPAATTVHAIQQKASCGELPTTKTKVHSNSFNYALDFEQINFRDCPEAYRVGRGEQGVLKVEPYKSEILPNWRFKNPEVATESSELIWQQFEAYCAAEDFVGADMARKFLQMGFTRARRYANYKGGKKYQGAVPKDKKGLSGAHGRPQLERSTEPDPIKAESARIFKAKWEQAEAHPWYKQEKQRFKDAFG